MSTRQVCLRRFPHHHLFADHLGQTKQTVLFNEAEALDFTVTMDEELTVRAPSANAGSPHPQGSRCTRVDPGTTTHELKANEWAKLAASDPTNRGLKGPRYLNQYGTRSLPWYHPHHSHT